MKTIRAVNLILLLIFVVTPLTFIGQGKSSDSQEKSNASQEQSTNDGKQPQVGIVEFGARGTWGEVYGRPDLPFSPSLKGSKYAEYRDLRDGFFIPRARLNWDNVASKYFVDFQAAKAIYRDQSYLATFGEWNRFKIQFRYDEIPHRYSDTARSIYTETHSGVFQVPLFTRNALQSIITSTTPNLLPSTIQNQIVPAMSFYTPAIERRAGSMSFLYDLTSDWDILASYAGEHESGHRPIGLIFNSSPSAALTGGYGAELPEPIDYFTHTIKVRTEYGRQRWAFQVGYLGSFFQNNIKTLDFENPFRTTDCVAAVTPAACTSATQGPAFGAMDLYPGNSANYITFAGSLPLMKHLRLLASINAGWLRQSDPFLPYTSNSVLEGLTSPLPAANLNGEKQTLAMNFTLIETINKKFEIKAGYRHYDYNNNTRILDFTPVQGDFQAPAPSPNPPFGTEENTPFGYNRKNIEVTGNWYFAKKSTAKIGYEGEIMDRSHRDVEHSVEKGLVVSVDTTPRKDLTFRIAYRYSVRNPESYDDDEATATAGGITNDSIFSRRFDEAARLRHRGDIELQYSPTDRLSFSGFGGTTQDNYNRSGGVNSSSPLNFISGRFYPYYLYGVLKDLSYNAGFDSDISLTNSITFFAEYSYERYYKAMASRYRVPGSGANPTPTDCSVSSQGCDTANNDWGSTSRDWVHIVSFGFDTQIGKKAFFDTYYSLSAAKGNVDSYALGNPAITTGPDKFLLFGTNAAVPYPETVSRNHEVVATFRYKLRPNLTPKIEYRYQQWDNRDYQTTAMTPYMGCVSPLPPSPAVPGCSSVVLGTASPYYPFFVVGDPSAARYLFMGVDQPSYRAHYLAATLEYSF
jgi:MtrB/PioB family decaheme-associated outer membrane protein